MFVIVNLSRKNASILTEMVKFCELAAGSDFAYANSGIFMDFYSFNFTEPEHCTAFCLKYYDFKYYDYIWSWPEVTPSIADIDDLLTGKML